MKTRSNSAHACRTSSSALKINAVHSSDVGKLYNTVLCHTSGGNTLQHIRYILVTKIHNGKKKKKKKKGIFCNVDHIIE
jgi:hypothetical protein